MGVEAEQRCGSKQASTILLPVRSDIISIRILPNKLPGIALVISYYSPTVECIDGNHRKDAGCVPVDSPSATKNLLPDLANKNQKIQTELGSGDM